MKQMEICEEYRKNFKYGNNGNEALFNNGYVINYRRLGYPSAYTYRYIIFKFKYYGKEEERVYILASKYYYSSGMMNKDGYNNKRIWLWWK